MTTFYLILNNEFNRHWFGQKGIIGRVLSELEFNGIVGHSIIDFREVKYHAPYAD